MNTNILLATPCYGNVVCTNYLLSIIQLVSWAGQNGVPVTFFTTGGDSLVTRARNNIVAYFLENPQYTHLMWVDADIGFEPQAFERLLRADKDVAAGVYPFKRIIWDDVRQAALRGETELEAASLRYVLNFKDPAHVVTQNGFAEVLDAATGFMLIKRSVFERMREAYPELQYESDSHDSSGAFNKTNNHYLFFDVMLEPETRRYLSEDYAFCRRWQAIGGEIWVDLYSKLSHQGSQVYHGNVQTALVAK